MMQMQHQPPSLNNPSNPLLKSAALRLDKEYVALDPDAIVRVVAALSFKRSDDFSGRAKGSDGEDITVCFRLAIQRASFELTFSFEGTEDTARKALQITQVAYLAPLEVRDRVVDQVSVSRGWSRFFSIGGSGKARVAHDALSAGTQLEAKAEAGGKNLTRIDRRISREFEKNNITATVGPNTIHWEISPGTNLDSKTVNWLDGEVFRSRDGSVDACFVKWNMGEVNRAFVISGSVFVHMQDLIADKINFYSDTGEKISWQDVDAQPLEKRGRHLLKSGVGLAGRFNKTEEQLRIVRQIIRKHLVSQGMRVHGARVEICKAHT